MQRERPVGSAPVVSAPCGIAKKNRGTIAPRPMQDSATARLVGREWPMASVPSRSRFRPKFADEIRNGPEEVPDGPHCVGGVEELCWHEEP